jgi:hypothetical protein
MIYLLLCLIPFAVAGLLVLLGGPAAPPRPVPPTERVKP